MKNRQENKRKNDQSSLRVTRSEERYEQLEITGGFDAGPNENGQLYIYVANETNKDQEVYFDDLKVTHESATANFKVSQINDFYPFGMQTTNSWRNDGYLDPGFLYQSSYAHYDSLTGYYDFLSRSYDPALGRFFAMDPAGQFSSPYVGMGNVPMLGVDPNGEFFLTAILGPVGAVIDAALWGAVIGGGTSAAVYTATSLASDNFDWGQLGKSAAFGAVAGAIGGGIGGAFTNSVFAQTAGFSLLNNTASTVAGTAILGGDITGGTILGGVVGGLVGSGIPQFSGVKGGVLSNISAEIGYNAVRGGITGAVSGGVSAAVDRRDIGQGIAQGALYGAVGGAAISSLKVLALGHTVKLDQEELDLIYSELGTNFSNYPPPIFRKGWFTGAGITIGRNISHHMVDDESPMMGPAGGRGGRAYNYSGFAHELKHYQQISKNGIGRFYGRLFGQYLRYGYRNSSFEVNAYKFGSRMNNVFRGIYQGRLK